MPFFDHNNSVEQLQQKAMGMYSNEGFRSLHKRGNFRYGLIAITARILEQMDERQFAECNAEFYTAVVDKNLLCFAEIAHQLATHGWSKHFTSEERFEWHYKAALLYSKAYILNAPSLPNDVKQNLLTIFFDVVNTNTKGMVRIDRKKAQEKLLESTPNSLFHSQLSDALQPKAAVSNSGPVTTELPATRPVLLSASVRERVVPDDLQACLKSNGAASYQHSPYAQGGTFPFTFSNFSSPSSSGQTEQQSQGNTPM